jgi:signal transduction histidine kinase
MVGFLAPDLAVPPSFIRFGNGLGIVQIALLPACVKILLGQRPQRWLWLPMALTVPYAVNLALPPGLPFRPPLGLILGFGVACLAVATGFAVQAFRRTRSTQTVLTLLICAPNLLGVLIFLAGRAVSSESLSAYGAGGQGVAVALPIIGLYLVFRWASAAKALDRANEHLAEELRRAEAQLTETLTRQHAQAQLMLLQTERERLIHDLHDGVSSQLISAVAACSMGGTAFREVEETLRGTLGELRLVITAMQDFQGELAQAIASFLPQLQRQVRPLGVTLICDVADLPPMPGLRPVQVQHVLRILQEAVTNAARHSGASEVWIEAAPDVPRITVRDAGRGGAREQGGSFGLRSMQRRAAELGAELRITSGARGTEIVLCLPSSAVALAAD